MSILFSHFFDKINQISPLEADFTEVLEPIALKPNLLYFRGKLPENVIKSSNSQKPLPGILDQNSPINPVKSHPSERPDEATPGSPALLSPRRHPGERPRTVAIVGSRHNTRYGEEVAYQLAYTLASRGVIIVSGLAYGIDSIAHRGCLDAGGRTVAVLGTPIDQIYPKSHLKLAQEIVEHDCAIISEYAPRTKEYRLAPLGYGESGLKHGRWVNHFTAAVRKDPSLLEPPFTRRDLPMTTSFLYRNRLISGLSDIVVVVEAAQRSGSLNTATHALEQGKEVFAVPGNINNPYSKGCNHLLAEGAHVYTEPEDILRLLFPEDYIKKTRHLRARQLIGDNDIESAILQAIAAGLRSSDDIMKEKVLPPEVFNESITLLEIKGRIKSIGMNNWTLIR
ncbi:DNA-protecting protein DprA [Candidatus Saccharibacteria bacterium]|nr:DNA-protecting protein DprA [Candidatus Saccharibacteria bacterium]